MKRPDYPGLAAFAAVAKHRNFRRAAAELGVSASALSHGLRALEETLGLRLLNWTTRSVSPTAAGERLLQRLAPAFADIAGAVDDLNAFRATPSGLLRLTAAAPAIRHLLGALTTAFLKAHPAMKVEIVESDRLVDIAAAGFDAGVRFGAFVERDMVAVPIGPAQRFLLVAAPGYLAGLSAPRHPRDLAAHRCLHYRYPSGRLYRWPLDKDGEAVQVEGEGPLVSNSLDQLLAAALDGLGIALVFEADARPHLAAGRLVTLLDGWQGPRQRFHLYYPSRRQMPAGLRAFIDLAS